MEPATKPKNVVRIECPPEGSGDRLMKNFISTALGYALMLAFGGLMIIGLAWCIAWLLFNFPGA